MTATDECVICGASIQPHDSGLCDDHKYDEQRAVDTTDERVMETYRSNAGLAKSGRCKRHTGDA